MSAKCGTKAGYDRHRRLGEQACAPCKAANAEAKRDYLAKAPEAKANQRAYGAAHQRALYRLADLHRDEFEALLTEERAT